jgi:hypothetical protein
MHSDHHRAAGSPAPAEENLVSQAGAVFSLSAAGIERCVVVRA